ncbi:MAG: beta strand repeat-containing protein, partial [Caulobacteraceae bacterium]
VDNTIVGSGFVNGPITNGAAGVIDANGAGNGIAFLGGNMVLQNAPITNNGLIESTTTIAGTFLDIRRGANVDQTGGGTILAANGATVDLETVQIAGGTLTTVGSGVINIQGQALLDGSASPLANKATIDLISNVNGYSLTLKGAIANSGSINIDTGAPTGRLDNLIVDPAGVTLTGAGVVTLAGDGMANIDAAAAGATLTNVNNTISGTGGIGASGLVLINEAAGVIDANQAKDLDVVGVITNTGLMEATVGALVLAGTISNAGGTIEANGGRVLLRGVDIEGGSIHSLGASPVATYGSGSMFNGTAHIVRLSGALTVTGATNLTLDGAIDNGGRINLAASAARPGNTDLIVGASGATLSGGGQVVLTAAATNRIYGASRTATLDNLDNRISGGGLIGNGSLTLVNGAMGVIVANSSTALVINTGSTTIENAGVIYTAKSGMMAINSAIDNSGSLVVRGGLLKVNGAVSGTGRAVVEGGVLDFTSSFGQNVQFGAAGTLELAQSHLYGGTLLDFSKTGGNDLDLADIAGGTASYSGTTSRGVLTVTGGGVTAHFKLIGDYTSQSFTTRSDGHGGTVVTAAPEGASAAATPPHALVAAMAALGAPSAAVTQTASETWRAHTPMLTAPRMCMA